MFGAAAGFVGVGLRFGERRRRRRVTAWCAVQSGEVSTHPAAAAWRLCDSRFGYSTWALTVLGNGVGDLEARTLARSLESTRGCSVSHGRVLSQGRGHDAVEVVVAVEQGLEESLGEAAAAHGANGDLQLVVQRDSVFRRLKRLAVFDLDSTLIVGETINELALEAGVSKEVAAVTAAAMNGQMDFQEALQLRLSLLKGLDLRALGEVRSRAKYTLGARRTVQALRSMGCATAVCSGGFTFLTNHVAADLGIETAVSNCLEENLSQGVLTGRVVGPIVDGQRKAEVLSELSMQKRLAREQVLAVGDGANDLPMLERAGLGIAFNAKPSVQARAPARVNADSMEAVLHLLGLDDCEIDLLCEQEAA